MLKVVLNARVPNLAPDQTSYAAPLLFLPERPDRFNLQTPNTDTGWMTKTGNFFLPPGTISSAWTRER